MWWHVGRPNFGDDLNPELFERLSGLPVRFQASRESPHLLGMGSILEKARPTSVVCGSGFLRAPQGRVASPMQLVAVRGALSREVFETDAPALLGDPAMLIGDLVDVSGEKHHRFGLVPHVYSIDLWRSMNLAGLKLIDPGLSPWQVVCEIAECEIIISQSLHGLVIADALGVPNVWVEPSDRMAGGRFKFDDYFTTLDSAKEMVPESEELFRNPSVFATSVGRYRYNKAVYRAALSAAAQALCPMQAELAASSA